MTGGLLNPTHVLFVIAVALLVLGPKRLPDVARAIGKGVRELRESVEGPAGVARSLFEDEPPESVGPPAATAKPPDVTPAIAPRAARADVGGAPAGAAQPPDVAPAAAAQPPDVAPVAPPAAPATAASASGGQREDAVAPSIRAGESDDAPSPDGPPIR